MHHRSGAYDGNSVLRRIAPELATPEISLHRLLALYSAMRTSRSVDAHELALIQRGEAFFHVSGAGHEAIAALADHLTAADWIHPHYRDKALLLARGFPVRGFFDALLCRAESCSAGRQMSAHLCDADNNVLSMTGPVGNNALQAVGVAAAIRDQAMQPIVVCSTGEGTTQQGEWLEAVAEAVRRQLPVLFLVADNKWAISTPTEGRTIASLPSGEACEFLGLPIRRVDGRDVLLADAGLAEAVLHVRESRSPALVWLQVERLANHTNADDQTLYRTAEDLAQVHAEACPIAKLEQHLLEQGVPAEQLASIADHIERSILAAAELALHADEPEPTFSAKAPLPKHQSEYRGDDRAQRQTMREALRDVLRHQLTRDSRVFLTGQDIEDPKGDVFGVTQGLSSEFPERVQNAALSESTIVGACIGRAIAGQRPVAFVQFADFLPLALNQIITELGTLYWRSAGEYQCPVIVMVTCGGYKPGLGPFHAHSLEGLAAHIPGVDVVMPYSAADAAGLLNAAFESPRPTLFFYPKSALNLAEQSTSADVGRQYVPIGKARRLRAGQDITLVGWGNTVALVSKTADALARIGLTADSYDLRSIVPWDEAAVIASAERTGRVLVVHEDSHTGGFGAEVLATLAERVTRPLRVKRVARPDVPVPCHFPSQLAVLPSFRRTLAAAAELLDLDLHWQDEPVAPADGRVSVPVIGSGPADERVVVLSLDVRPGDRVEVGQRLAVVEASKSTVEMVAPQSGIVESLAAEPDEAIPVGQPLLWILPSSPSRPQVLTHERPGQPILQRRAVKAGPTLAEGFTPNRSRFVGVQAITGAVGSRFVPNSELLHLHPKRSSADIVKRTGIESRHWIAPGENVVSLGVRAMRELLESTALSVHDLDLVICSTGSPLEITPALACRVLAELAGPETANVTAYDINAACSGYLYALQIAHDYLQSRPTARVVVLTAETPSARLNRNDFDTAFLFGDAATATLLVGETHARAAWLKLHRPLLAASCERERSLYVPLTNGDQYIAMRGLTVYSEAVYSMAGILQEACAQSGLTKEQLDLIVPHQASQRILDAVAGQIDRPVFSNIAKLGNTSSSTIPMALLELRASGQMPHILGLCAFGGGFTYAGGIAERLD